jgi:hypothetical protein
MTASGKSLLMVAVVCVCGITITLNEVEEVDAREKTRAMTRVRLNEKGKEGQKLTLIA